MRNYCSNNALKVPKSELREFFEIAKSVENIISLSVGEPDFETPWRIKEECINSINSNKTYYTESLGILPLREAICQYTYDSLGINYNPHDQVLVTVGASEAVDLIIRTTINQGDEVILLAPSYVMYEPCVILQGGVPVFVELKQENEFKLLKEDLVKAITDKTKIIIMNYPSNPTGGIMTNDDYKEIVDIIKENNILVISDEIYAELQYEGKHCSLAQFAEIKDQVLIVNGFSKAYAMTGYRLGYILGNKELIDLMCLIHQYTIMNPTTSSQYAGVVAIKECQNDIVNMRNEFMLRRNYLVNNLNRIGLHCHMPKGAFYVFASIKNTGMTSYDFCLNLVKKEKVAIVPGTAFGQSGEGYVRISYAYSLKELKFGVEAIERFMSSLK